MSDILNNLKKILNSVYGKDVRQAIHDAIYDCYEDGKAGSVDLVARSGIDALAANLNTEYGSEVLYEDSTGAKQIGAEITLADDYDEFDYLDIYTYTTARDEVHTVSTAYASVSLRIPNIVNSDSSYTPTTTLLLDELTLGFSGNKIVISDHVQWKWTGAADAAATRTAIDSDVAQTTSIRKVVGRKISANAEVEDIRTGWDGTEYESAGDAVRGQIEQVLGGGGGGSGLTDDIKEALLACFAHVAWVDDDGQDYYDALEAALYPPANVVSISAVYTQSGTVYDTDSLDSLRSDLVVTATYSDTTTDTVTTYTLSGTLAEGTSTITVAFGGKTDTFEVTVTELLPTGYTAYDYISNESNNAAYIRMDIPTADADWYDYEIGVEFRYTGTTPSEAVIFGGRNAVGGSSTTKGLMLATVNDTLKAHYVNGSDGKIIYSIAYPFTPQNRHTVKLKSGDVFIDGTLMGNQGGTTNAFVSGSYKFDLFRRNQKGTHDSPMTGRIYGFYVIDGNGDDVVRYIPCRRNSDSKYGMYDLVAEEFISSYTATEFTGGNE